MIVTVIAFSLLSNKTPFFIFVYPSQEKKGAVIWAVICSSKFPYGRKLM
jgi:hypothetical protein